MERDRVLLETRTRDQARADLIIRNAARAKDVETLAAEVACAKLRDTSEANCGCTFMCFDKITK